MVCGGEVVARRGALLLSTGFDELAAGFGELAAGVEIDTRGVLLCCAGVGVATRGALLCCAGVDVPISATEVLTAGALLCWAGVCVATIAAEVLASGVLLCCAGDEVATIAPDVAGLLVFGAGVELSKTDDVFRSAGVLLTAGAVLSTAGAAEVSTARVEFPVVERCRTSVCVCMAKYISG